MKLVLRNTSGETVSLYIQQDETFQDLKERVQNEVGIVLDLQDLTIKGKTISDSQKVIDYFATQEAKEGEEKPEIEEDVKCSVPGCPNTKFTCPEKAFFHFPLEEVRCHQWALYCQRLSEQSGKHRLSLNLNSVICADHFRKDQFVKNTTTLLKRTAVPCVKPEIPSCVEPVIPKRRPFYTSQVKPDVELPLTLPTLETALAFMPVMQNNGKEMLCRLCANSCTEFVFIFDDVGNKLSISEKINTCLPITVHNTDPLPKQLCRICFEKLNMCHELSESCLKAESKLKDLIKEKHFRTRVLDDMKLDESLPELLKSEGQISQCNSENSMVCELKGGKKPLYCCPLCTSGRMMTKSGIYKTPAIEETNSINSTEVAHSDKVEESDAAVEMFSGGEDTDGEPATTNGDAKDIWNGQDYGLKIPELDMDSLYNDASEIVGMELDSIDEEPWAADGADEEEEDVKPVIKGEKEFFTCRLCGTEFLDLLSLLEHSESHSDDDCYPCSYCDRYYPTRNDLEAHFREHQIPKKKNSLDTQYSQCDTCGMSFKSVVKFQNHVCGTTNNSSNRCVHCNKSFRSEARLKFHQRFHEGAKPGYCEICQKTFPDEIKLYKHTMYLHSQNKGHCCEECGKVFKSVSSLRYHQRSHQGEDIMKPYPCEQCGKCFIRKSMLRNHMLATHKNMSQEGSCFTCKLCSEAFPGTDHAVAHMDFHHMTECTGETTYSFEMHTVTRLYICEYCERCFTDPIHLNNHRELHAPDIPYQCKLCNTTFSAYSGLDQHKHVHYEAGLQDYASDFTVPTVYMCEFCERCFLNYIKLSEHLTVHYGEDPYQCRFCNLRFKTYLSVSEHRLTHDQSVAPIDDFDFYRPYECHYCRKAFAIEDALVKHIRMHTGEKPFICDQCGKGFSQSSGLYTHQKVHSNERPYSCPVCPRTFKIKGDRDVHVRKHSGDRPYKCDFCGKAFMTQHVYSQHRKIHTGERPYKCDVCGIAFRRSHVLTVHKRIHTGEKPNICDICGKRYRQKGDMLKHRRIQHGIVKVKIQRIEF